MSIRFKNKIITFVIWFSLITIFNGIAREFRDLSFFPNEISIYGVRLIITMFLTIQVPIKIFKDAE